MEGTTLNNRYQITTQVGQGGMGTVYRAYDTDLQREVAIKVLNKTGLDSAGRSQLLHEARAAAQLDHPNIVTVYDVGQADEAPYLIMQWVDGTTLYTQPPETLVETLKIARQICAALAHSHARGIVHRDLKPENVMVSPDGVARLMDFGLARSTSRLSVEEGLVGTVAYMPPEQALNQPSDGRTDLYSLGVLLYELVTGQLPFQAEDLFGLITQHLYAPVVPPRVKNAAIPPALNQLILAMLAKKPAERPESAEVVDGELQAIIQALDPEAETISASTQEFPATTPAAFLERIVRGQLVGRQTELALLREGWARVREGAGWLVLVSGEPGIGKTRLVQELVTQVKVQSGRVLIGANYPEQPVPFSPFAQMVMEVFSSESSDSLVDAFTLAELIRLAPPLQRQYLHTPPNPELEAQAAQYRMFTGLVTLCKTLAARTPLLLVLEDVHWADEGTLALLLHLARATRDLPVLLVVTYRETDLGDSPALQNTLRELDRARLGQRVKLVRFDLAGTRALLEKLFGEAITPDFLSGIYRETEGVPFFVEEVCKTLVESGEVYYAEGRWHRPENMADLAIPQSVQVAVQRRVARLASETIEVLTVAALLGRVFDYDLLGAVTEKEEDLIYEAIETAETSQLLHEESGARGGTFAFSHALIPGTLVEGLSGLRQRRWHLKVAEVLARLRPQETNRIAHHYWGAENPAGVPYLQKAGDQAAAQYANADAVQWYARALELVPDENETQRFALLEAREKVYDLLGRREEQREDLAWMATLADRLGETAPVRVAVRQAHLAMYTSDYPNAVLHAQTAIEAARQLEKPELAVSAYFMWGGGLYYSGQKHAAQGQFQKGLELAEEAGDQRAAGNCVLGLGAIFNDWGHFPAARECYERALSTFREIGDRARETVAIDNLGLMAARQGDIVMAQEYYERSLAISQEIGKRFTEGSTLSHLGNLASDWLRDMAAAEDYFLQALAIYREVDERSSEGWVLNQLGDVSLYRGDYAVAKGFFEQVQAIFRDVGNLQGKGHVLVNLGLVAANQGDTATARDYLEQALAIFPDISTQGSWCLWELGVLALEDNDLPLAESYSQQALAFRREQEQPRNLVGDWAVLAKLNHTQRNQDRAREYAEHIQDYLQENPRLAGVSSPIRAFRYVWEVWVALGETDKADGVLALAAALMQDYLDKNPDAAVQEMFLCQRHHTVLWNAWTEKNAG